MTLMRPKTRKTAPSTPTKGKTAYFEVEGFDKVRYYLYEGRSVLGLITGDLLLYFGVNPDLPSAPIMMRSLPKCQWRLIFRGVLVADDLIEGFAGLDVTEHHALEIDQTFRTPLRLKSSDPRMPTVFDYLNQAIRESAAENENCTFYKYSVRIICLS